MAVKKTSRNEGVKHSAGARHELSAFESRCLLKRICECHEVLCLAILNKAIS